MNTRYPSRYMIELLLRKCHCLLWGDFCLLSNDRQKEAVTTQSAKHLSKQKSIFPSCGSHHPFPLVRAKIDEIHHSAMIASMFTPRMCRPAPVHDIRNGSCMSESAGSMTMPSAYLNTWGSTGSPRSSHAMNRSGIHKSTYRVTLGITKQAIVATGMTGACRRIWCRVPRVAIECPGNNCETSPGVCLNE